MSGLPEIDGVTDLTEIGRGGFGVVYRGHETAFDREVAVKVLMPSLDERTRKRFERERRAMGVVTGHPNVVTVFRGGTTESHQPYLVMEYLPGGSLSERLRDDGAIDWRTAASIGSKLAMALDTAHKAGVLHRDVKPGNVFQTASGEPKLGDFGIARLDDGHDSRSGSITASIAHAAPEIVDAERGDERSDLYSLASTIYALARGAAPFAREGDDSISRMLSRIANEMPPPLGLEPEAAGFEAVVLRALNKRPEDRQPTVAEFGRQLQLAAAGQIHVQPAPVTEARQLAADATSHAEPHSPARKTGIGQIVGFMALALAIAGFGGWAVSRAVFGPESGLAVSPTAIAAATVLPLDTPIPVEPTAVPPTVAPLEPDPTPVPAPTLAALSTPVPASRSLTTVVDPTGALSIDVPRLWATTVVDGTNPSLADITFSYAALGAGGDFDQLGGVVGNRDLARSGVTILASRLPGVDSDSETWLDVAVESWDNCVVGERSQVLLNPGNADVQLLQCDDESTGDSAGVVIFSLVPRQDADVIVVMVLQLAAESEIDNLIEITSSLRIDTDLIPGG